MQYLGRHAPDTLVFQPATASDRARFSVGEAPPLDADISPNLAYLPTDTRIRPGRSPWVCFRVGRKPGRTPDVAGTKRRRDTDVVNVL